MTTYNNIPQPKKSTDSASQTLKIFDAYTAAPISIDVTTFEAMKGFFESRGFGSDSATSIAYIILQQSVKDRVNPFKLIDTLKGVSDVQLSTLITDILNYNRYKTSSLGSSNAFTPAAEVARNIVV